MTNSARRLLFWSPRVLAIAFALFVSLFALDVLGEGGGFRHTTVALAMHLIPAALVVIALALAWRWEWVGGALFIALGLSYTRMNLNHPDWILVIAGPLFLVGGLFLAGWFTRTEVRARPWFFGNHV